MKLYHTHKVLRIWATAVILIVALGGCSDQKEIAKSEIVATLPSTINTDARFCSANVKSVFLTPSGTDRFEGHATVKFQLTQIWVNTLTPNGSVFDRKYLAWKRETGLEPNKNYDDKFSSGWYQRDVDVEVTFDGDEVAVKYSPNWYLK